MTLSCYKNLFTYGTDLVVFTISFCTGLVAESISFVTGVSVTTCTGVGGVTSVFAIGFSYYCFVVMNVLGLGKKRNEHVEVGKKEFSLIAAECNDVSNDIIVVVCYPSSYHRSVFVEVCEEHIVLFGHILCEISKRIRSQSLHGTLQGLGVHRLDHVFQLLESLQSVNLACALQLSLELIEYGQQICKLSRLFIHELDHLENQLMALRTQCFGVVDQVAYSCNERLRLGDICCYTFCSSYINYNGILRQPSLSLSDAILCKIKIAVDLCNQTCLNSHVVSKAERSVIVFDEHLSQLDQSIVSLSLYGIILYEGLTDSVVKVRMSFSGRMLTNTGTDDHTSEHIQ